MANKMQAMVCRRHSPVYIVDSKSLKTLATQEPAFVFVELHTLNLDQRLYWREGDDLAERFDQAVRLEQIMKQLGLVVRFSLN